jgi:hypothetical protein
MPTRREVIMKHYQEMHRYANEHMPGLFPHPSEISAEDVVLVMCHYFTPWYHKGDYTSPLKQLQALKGVKLSEDEFRRHYEALRGHLHDLCGFIKSI